MQRESSIEKLRDKVPELIFNRTTQGRYMATADGQLLGYNNNRGAEKLIPLMKRALAEFQKSKPMSVALLPGTDRDPRRHIPPPAGSTVVSVNARVLDGYQETSSWTRVFHDSISRDNFWILAEELPELVLAIKNGGKVPERIAKRLARFHLIDNTRGEPPRWSIAEIKKLELDIGKEGTIRGSVHLETESGDRGYRAELLGKTAAHAGKLTRFDLVAKGQFWGCGTLHLPCSRREVYTCYCFSNCRF